MPGPDTGGSGTILGCLSLGIRDAGRCGTVSLITRGAERAGPHPTLGPARCPNWLRVLAAASASAHTTSTPHTAATASVEAATTAVEAATAEAATAAVEAATA